MNDALMSAAVLLANVYASFGQSHKASDIRINMIKSDVKKKVALTCTRVSGLIYVS